MEKERIGLSKWHHNLSKRNEEYKNSEEYKTDNEEERIRRLQANSEDFDTEKGIFEKEGIDLDEIMRREFEEFREDNSPDDGKGTDREHEDDETDGYDN